MPADPHATALLRASPEQEGALIELVWQELREHASRLLLNERKGHTLQPTALVNEVYLRLIDTTAVNGDDQRRFMILAARCMRRVLIDHARKRGAQRRGGKDWVRVSLHPGVAEETEFTADLLDLGPALERLAELDPRAAEVVELRFFGGLTEVETAEVLGVTDRTVRSDWRTARAWLRRELDGAGGADSEARGA